MQTCEERSGVTMMVSWSDVLMQEEQHRQQLRLAERAAQIEAALKQTTADRWQWRVMKAIGEWLMDLGCRLQTHVETARQAVTAPQRAMESNPPGARPCP
jgi:hypothetical protein